MKIFKILTAVIIFAIAMSFLESAVVVYLRELLYPNGFTFPLAPMPNLLALTEILREAATLIMLIGLGYIAGKSLTDRFAWFLLAFAVWDIFYYVFLKVLLNWPESLHTWDILFLIPLPWTGPVIAPIIVSFSMIYLALLIILAYEKGLKVRLKIIEWTALAAGSIVLIVSFTWDYSVFILKDFPANKFLSMPDKNVLYDYVSSYVPQRFNWSLFITGQLIILAAIIGLNSRLFRNRKNS